MPGIWGEGPRGGIFGARVDPALLRELEKRAANRRSQMVLEGARGRLDPARVPPRNPDIPFREGLAGTAGEMLYGVPVAGPALLGAGERMVAGKHSLMEGKPYSEALEEAQTRQENFRRDQPLISGSAQAGGQSLLAPAFGASVPAQMIGNAALGGADAIVRGQDPRMAAGTAALAAAIPIPGAGPAMRRAVEGRISTRFPTAKTATEDPLSHTLTLGREDVIPTENMDLIRGYSSDLSPSRRPKTYRGYPGMAHAKDAPPMQLGEEYINWQRDNLLFLHDAIPGGTRAQSKEWYDGANLLSNVWAKDYDLPQPAVAGVMAVLSPQKDWFQNASLAQRVIDTNLRNNGARFTTEMRDKWATMPALEDYSEEVARFTSRGETLDQLDDPVERALWIRLYDETFLPRNYRTIHPSGQLGEFAQAKGGKSSKIGWGSLNEIAKADAALRSGGDLNQLSALMGNAHKVRNFFNNINVPKEATFGDATMDTHAVAAAHLQPFSGKSTEVSHVLGTGLQTKDQPRFYEGPKGSSVTGVQGTYGLPLDAYREAAAARGILPREMQSITWEAVRGMFSPAQKRNPEFVAGMRDIWRQVDAGRLTADQARRLILQQSGGITPPVWEQSGARLYDPARTSTYSGEIYSPQLGPVTRRGR
jgi:hypothetical protein